MANQDKKNCCVRKVYMSSEQDYEASSYSDSRGSGTGVTPKGPPRQNVFRGKDASKDNLGSPDNMSSEAKQSARDDFQKNPGAWRRESSQGGTSGRNNYPTEGTAKERAQKRAEEHAEENSDEINAIDNRTLMDGGNFRYPPSKPYMHPETYTEPRNIDKDATDDFNSDTEDPPNPYDEVENPNPKDYSQGNLFYRWAEFCGDEFIRFLDGDEGNKQDRRESDKMYDWNPFNNPY